MTLASGIQIRVSLAGLQPLQGRRVASPLGELALFRLSDGSVKVLLNSCPHKQGSLAEGIVSGDHVFCTQHDWKICLSDGQAQAPDRGCVQTFEAEIQGEFAVIKLGGLDA